LVTKRIEKTVQQIPTKPTDHSGKRSFKRKWDIHRIRAILANAVPKTSAIATLKKEDAA
jgi:hypothetical protein